MRYASTSPKVNSPAAATPTLRLILADAESNGFVVFGSVDVAAGTADAERLLLLLVVKVTEAVDAA
jgi:hypothetical protein